LQFSYDNRPSFADITFPHKFYPKKYIDHKNNPKIKDLPAEITDLSKPINEEHFKEYDKETLF